MRWARTRVLPDPAPARISSGPSVVVTARACSGFSARTICGGALLAATGDGRGIGRWRGRRGRIRGPGTGTSRSHSGSSGTVSGVSLDGRADRRGGVVEGWVAGPATTLGAHPAILGRVALRGRYRGTASGGGPCPDRFPADSSVARGMRSRRGRSRDTRPSTALAHAQLQVLRGASGYQGGRIAS